jgi:hypothetical protein
MSYHVLIYTANTNSATNFDSVPVADSWIGIQNNHFFPQLDLNLFGGWFGGANLTAATLVTPRSRLVVPPRLYPIQGSLLPPDRPHIWDRRNNPFLLRAIEEISLQMNIGGTANAINTGVMFAGDVLSPVPPGDIYTLHGTSTTAAVANVWTQVVITWDQTIPAGNYVVVGSWHQSTNAIAHRFNFRNQLMRPGMLSVTALANISDPSYYYGGWGALGTFNTTAYPFIEVYVNGTDNAHDVGMNMIKVG